MSDVPVDWYEGFFEGEWLDYLAAGDPEGNAEQVAFLAEQLGLGEGTRVLDLACGRGRIAIPLARRGCRVTGLDLSPRSLELARHGAATAGVDLELIHADMRDLDAAEKYEVVLNLFSSFGYFVDEADDERVVAAVSRALVPDGTFFIDTINPLALARILTPVEIEEFADGTLLLERRRFDHLHGRLVATWLFVGNDGTRTTATALAARLHTSGARRDAAPERARAHRVLGRVGRKAARRHRAHAAPGAETGLTGREVTTVDG